MILPAAQNRRGRDDPGNPIADYTVPTLASLLSYPVAINVLAYLDAKAVLLALAALITILMAGVMLLAQWWFLRDDGRIDAFERVWLYFFTLLSWLAAFVTLQFLVAIVTELLVTYPLPFGLEIVLDTIVMLLLIIALVPRYTRMLTPAKQ